MIKFSNRKEVEGQLKNVFSALDKIVDFNGQDIAQKVKNAMRSEGPPMSKEGSTNGVRDALVEAVYRGDVAGETANAQKAMNQLNIKEQEVLEDKIIDKYLRDFFNEIFREV